MIKEKVRVYQLARELNMESKDLLDLCQDAGIELRNQLSSLDPEQRDEIEQLVKRGKSASKNASSTKKSAPVMPQPLTRSMRTLQTKPRPTAQPEVAESAKYVADPDPADGSEELAPDVAEVDSAPTPAVDEPLTEQTVIPDQIVPVEYTTETDDETTIGAEELPTTAAEVESETESAGALEETTSSTPLAARPPLPAKIPTLGRDKKIRDLNSKTEKEKPKPRPQPQPPRPTPMTTAKPTPPPSPAPTPKPAAKKDSKKSKVKTQVPTIKLTPEMLKDIKNRRKTVSEIIQDQQETKPLPTAGADDEDSGKKTDKRKKRGVGNREERKKAREERARVRKQKLGEVQLDHGKVMDVEEGGVKTRQPRRKGRRPAARVIKPREGKITIEPPITVRSLSEAIGIKASPLLAKLMNYGVGPININTTLETEVAEELALEEGCELEIKRAPDAEEQLLTKLQVDDEPNQLVGRAPIVTIMGHVDHGKTSLLDKIRQTNVVATEAGGITQVIRAWRVEHDGKPITFLDTPGHEAFTKMRARGAQVTDIAVIVVAADDSVMPQTEEAINHAKAAGVSLVIAINKIDVPNANLNKTRQQLYSLNILPDNMGGDTPFVETSAVTGEGVEELLENISLLAEFKELTANPNKPGQGICLEANLSNEEGVQATLLVQEGTVHRGDIIICGATYGRIRQMYDDQKRSIHEAGPSVPIRITGLSSIPNADDPFVVAPDLITAREIAEKRQQQQQEALNAPRNALELLRLSEKEISELKLIVKADFRGSIEAIRKELEKLEHDEVRVKILHTGIGGITENDVQLALTSPEDTVIVGFNVVPDDRARVLADEKGIPLREYNVIYMLTDDIKAALEGKLKPRQEIVHLGRAVVRDTFKISRVGTIAGCYVTQGVIQRNAKVRLIREGAVIYPPPERTAGLDSLKRFKDDASEVREGFECGIKIAGYDDIKVDDVIEAFRVEEVQRTLDS